jgi:excisionase family DNA binding protein
MSTNTDEEKRGAPHRRGLTVKQFEQASGLSHATVYRLIAAGKIKTVKVLGRRIIPDTTLDALLEEGAQ